MSAIGVYATTLAELNPLEPVTSVPLLTFQIGSWQLVLSNHALVVVVTALILLLVIPRAARAPKFVPGRLQNVVESICVFLREEMAKPVLGHHTDQYIGLLWTIFFFVLTLNLVGMIPTDKIVPLITGKPCRLGGPATANIYVTGALAAVTFVMSHILGIRKQGLIHYVATLAPPSPTWLLPLIYPLELITIFIRPFTLAIRLFANIVAGHMVLGTFLGLIFVFKNLGVAAASISACVALSFLELLVAFVQAFIFAFLATVYIGAAIGSQH
jgi:F-type H+-transporting ATPase subunit a